MSLEKVKQGPGVGEHYSLNLEIPCAPVVRTWCCHCRGLGSIPGGETKIPQAAWHSQEKKKKKKPCRTI